MLMQNTTAFGHAILKGSAPRCFDQALASRTSALKKP
jgi:hypothetical protein